MELWEHDARLRLKDCCLERHAGLGILLAFFAAFSGEGWRLLMRRASGCGFCLRVAGPRRLVAPAISGASADVTEDIFQNAITSSVPCK